MKFVGNPPVIHAHKRGPLRFSFPPSNKVSFHSQVKDNATTWPAPNVWIFIAQLVDYCSANPEAMGSNPVEVPKLFSGSFAIA